MSAPVEPLSGLSAKQRQALETLTAEFRQTWDENRLADQVRQRPAGTINQQCFAAILRLAARFKTERESQGLTLAQVAERMGIDVPALSRLETGKMLSPTLATLHKWAEALGRKLDLDLSSA